jgi:hypothetical protein
MATAVGLVVWLVDVNERNAALTLLMDHRDIDAMRAVDGKVQNVVKLLAREASADSQNTHRIDTDVAQRSAKS